MMLKGTPQTLKADGKQNAKKAYSKLCPKARNRIGALKVMLKGTPKALKQDKDMGVSESRGPNIVPYSKILNIRTPK